jgi:MoaA/NifB/PqqE/SkfB family radical SAM enzyme
MNPFNNNKIFNHMDRVFELKKTEHTAPIHVYFVISDVCNHGCSFCLYRVEGEISNDMFDVTRMIPVERAISLLGEFKEAGIKAVEFTGGGEPTIHPQFESIFGHAHLLGLQTGIVTNGQRMSDNTKRLLLDAVWVRVSFDAATARTHSQLRNISDKQFGEVISNVQDLTDLVAQRESKVTVGISYIVTRENWCEIFQAAELARNLGVAYIRFATRNSYPEGFSYYNGLTKQIQEQLARAAELKTDAFNVIDTFDERLADLEQGHPDYSFCMQQRLSTYIGADLNVYRCCITAYNKEYGLLGSVKNQSMFSLWNSEEVKKKLNELDAKTCPRCQFNIRNRQAISIMDSITFDHKNFY